MFFCTWRQVSTTTNKYNNIELSCRAALFNCWLRCYYTLYRCSNDHWAEQRYICGGSGWEKSSGRARPLMVSVTHDYSTERTTSTVQQKPNCNLYDWWNVKLSRTWILAANVERNMSAGFLMHTCQDFPGTQSYTATVRCVTWTFRIGGGHSLATSYH